jgi:hypothetical protein
MKGRIRHGFPRRLTLGIVAAGLVVLLALAMAHPDHIEAWHFQLTRPTVAITPSSSGYSFLQHLADYSGSTVRIDSAEKQLLDKVLYFLPNTLDEDGTPAGDVHVEYVRRLESWGWRVVEQRFPSRAYVVLPGVSPAIPPELMLWCTVDDLLDGAYRPE